MKDAQPTEDKPITEQQQAELFVKEYQALCSKHGYQIVVTPAYKSRDDGTFSTVLQSSVGRLPKDETSRKINQ